jgi:hypothetical protein
MSFEVTKQEILKQAIALNVLWKQTRDQKYRDEELRLRRIVLELDSIDLDDGVNSIIAGDGISISPSSGVGDVIISVIEQSPVYGSFFSDQNQSLSDVNVQQIVSLNNTYETNGVSISDNKIVFASAGTYQFSYVAQVFNNSNDTQHCEFWIKYNGLDFPNSATHITVNARKSSTEPSEQQMKLILSGTAQNDDDYIELYWQGSSVGLLLGYVPVGIDGPVASPSVIANVIKL